MTWDKKASPIDDSIAVSPFTNPNCSVKSPIYKGISQFIYKYK